MLQLLELYTYSFKNKQYVEGYKITKDLLDKGLVTIAIWNINSVIGMVHAGGGDI